MADVPGRLGIYPCVCPRGIRYSGKCSAALTVKPYGVARSKEPARQANLDRSMPVNGAGSEDLELTRSYPKATWDATASRFDSGRSDYVTIMEERG